MENHNKQQGKNGSGKFSSVTVTTGKKGAEED